MVQETFITFLPTFASSPSSFSSSKIPKRDVEQLDSNGAKLCRLLLGLNSNDYLGIVPKTRAAIFRAAQLEIIEVTGLFGMEVITLMLKHLQLKQPFNL